MLVCKSYELRVQEKQVAFSGSDRQRLDTFEEAVGKPYLAHVFVDLLARTSDKADFTRQKPT